MGYIKKKKTAKQKQSEWGNGVGGVRGERKVTMLSDSVFGLPVCLVELTQGLSYTRQALSH